MFLFCLLLLSASVRPPSTLTVAMQRDLLDQSNLVDCKWTECVLTCKKGSVSTDNQRRALGRINFFRRLVGLDSVVSIPELNDRAQQAAFLCHANKRLGHHANENWRCYTEAGDSALALSNLRFFDSKDFISKRDISPINGFIEDYGPENESLGHRRWLLFSQLRRVGYGATRTTEAVYLDLPKEGSYDLITPEVPWIAYPPAGRISSRLVFPKWSFALPLGQVDFSRTSVTMRTSSGKAIRVKKFKPVDGYGDPTIGWDTKSLFEQTMSGLRLRQEFLNVEIFVQIDSVLVKGESKSFRYSTEIVAD